MSASPHEWPACDRDPIVPVKAWCFDTNFSFVPWGPFLRIQRIEAQQCPSLVVERGQISQKLKKGLTDNYCKLWHFLSWTYGIFGPNKLKYNDPLLPAFRFSFPTATFKVQQNSFIIFGWDAPQERMRFPRYVQLGSTFYSQVTSTLCPSIGPVLLAVFPDRLQIKSPFGRLRNIPRCCDDLWCAVSIDGAELGRSMQVRHFDISHLETKIHIMNFVPRLTTIRAWKDLLYFFFYKDVFFSGTLCRSLCMSVCNLLWIIQPAFVNQPLRFDVSGCGDNVQLACLWADSAERLGDPPQVPAGTSCPITCKDPFTGEAILKKTQGHSWFRTSNRNCWHSQISDDWNPTILVMIWNHIEMILDSKISWSD